MPATAVLTSDQYLALPEEFDQNGNRVKDELIGGEIVKMPPASLVHDRIKNRISRLLNHYLDANPGVRLEVLVETGARVSNVDTYIPDVGVVNCERFSSDDRILRGAPDLAIEVISPGDVAVKLKIKIDAYLQNGSRSVWIVYPDSRSLMIHTADSVRELKNDQTLEDPTLPGFSIAVSRFFDLT